MQVAVDPAGDAVFVWGRRSGAAHGDFEVQTRTRYANGSLSPIQTLSKPSDGLMRPQVAVDSGGDAVFIWRRNDQSTQEMRVEARTAPTGW